MSDNVLVQKISREVHCLSNRYNPSETTRRAPFSEKEIIAYLNGASHDASLNKRRRVRFVQKDKGWLITLQNLLNMIGDNSWIYKEGKTRNVFVLETLCNKIDFSFDPRNFSKEEKIMYIRGFFDAEGGIPRKPGRFYIQIAQKNLFKIKSIKHILSELGIESGVIHNPSKKVDPNYWRISILSNSQKKFAEIIGSLHPVKHKIFQKRMEI